MSYLDKKSFKDMTPEERILYKKHKKFKRKVQVYAEFACMGIAVVALAAVIIVHATGGTATAKNSDEQELTEEKPSGLRISNSGNANVTEPEEEETASEDTSTENNFDTFGIYETDSTSALSGDINSTYSILVNLDNGEILGEKNSFDRMIPASMTKVMTVLTASHYITEDQLDDKVVLSHEAVDYSYANGCSTSGFEEGEEVTVRDLFYGTILPSGGDAACQLAMYVAGDVDSFVELMNQDLNTMGLSETTHFTNPVGIYADDHYSTAHDIAVIFATAMQDDFLSQVLSAHTYNSSVTSVHPEGIIISNWFLRRIEDKDFGGTIIGAKTGYVTQSGNCAVSCEQSENGTRYLCVTASASSAWQCIYDHVAIYSNNCR